MTFRAMVLPLEASCGGESSGVPKAIMSNVNLSGVRVLARIPNLAVQIYLWVISYFCGRGRTKTCVLGCCRNFLFLRSYTLIPSVIFRHTVFSKG